MNRYRITGGLIMKKIERLEKKVYDADNKLSIAVQAFEECVVFSDDFDEYPQISMASSNELVAVWHGKELPSNIIVSLMLEKGYIEPSDFI